MMWIWIGGLFALLPRSRSFRFSLDLPAGVNSAHIVSPPNPLTSSRKALAVGSSVPYVFAEAINARATHSRSSFLIFKHFALTDLHVPIRVYSTSPPDPASH